ncbi:MAG: 23S rRNA (guanosine(2251)-2'-O)-methyltransferase RlmB [Cyanobacteria bacterium HKST-UBA04]|nr:23S rRNA (guanosine(2251)-2'-O)-methyltransferase RlmB [Cyanobacteria bacterium HKST-UBA04]
MDSNPPASNPHQSVVFGKNPVQVLLEHHPKRVLKVLVSQRATAHRRIKALVDQAKGLGIATAEAPVHKLETLVEGQNHQGIVALTRPRDLWSLADLTAYLDRLPAGKVPLLLALDNITDVHNVGAIIRSAAACGVDAIVLPKMGSGGLSPVVSKTSAGTDMLVNLVVVPNLANAMKVLKDQGIWWLGTSLGPTSQPYDAYRDYHYPTGIVMGSEDKGLRPVIEKHCDVLLHIPMAVDVESLNVSVACGIILFEASRQRRQLAQTVQPAQ